MLYTVLCSLTGLILCIGVKGFAIWRPVSQAHGMEGILSRCLHPSDASACCCFSTGRSDIRLGQMLSAPFPLVAMFGKKRMAMLMYLALFLQLPTSNRPDLVVACSCRAAPFGAAREMFLRQFQGFIVSLCPHDLSFRSGFTQVMCSWIKHKIPRTSRTYPAFKLPSKVRDRLRVHKLPSSL